MFDPHALGYTMCMVTTYKVQYMGVSLQKRGDI